MLQLRATAKARKLANIKDTDLSTPVSDKTALGAWYLNSFQLGRRKAIIFMNEKSLLSFIVFGVRKDNVKNLPNNFRVGLAQLLGMIGVSHSQIERVLLQYESHCYTKTLDKSALGSMNDLVSLYQEFVWRDGGLEHCILDEIIIRINQTPQRRIDWNFSLNETIELIENESAI